VDGVVNAISSILQLGVAPAGACVTARSAVFCSGFIAHASTLHFRLTRKMKAYRKIPKVERHRIEEGALLAVAIWRTVIFDYKISLGCIAWAKF